MPTLWAPNPRPQTAFLSSVAREVLYGGAAGGSKSDGLIIAPLRWVDNPRHRAVILRRTRPELQELIDRSTLLYPGCNDGATWNEQRSRWQFPSGAIIRFGHAEHEDDILNFKSDQYNYVGFDELTTFTEKQWLFMFSRNRTIDMSLPLMMRAATNPGDIGHEWVFRRFVETARPYHVYNYPVTLPDGKIIDVTRQFIPATVYDNLMLANRDGYIAGLASMGKDMAAALLYGRWDLFEGQFFKAHPKQVPHGLKDTEYYVIRCMDYGFNDPTAVYWIVCYPKLQLLEIVAEVYVSETVIPDIAGLVLRRQTRLQTEDSVTAPPRLSVGDPNSMFRRESTSQQTIAQMLSRHGVNFTPANDDRAAGWSMLQYLLASGKLCVWEGRAPNLMRTLPTLKYHDKKKDDIKTGGSDHSADALRYGVLGWYEQPASPTAPPPMDPLTQDVVFPKLKKVLEKQGRFAQFEGLGEGW